MSGSIWLSGNFAPSVLLSLPDATVVMIQEIDRTHVAWDIETTGFGWSDQITVSGFWLPTGRAELVINTNGEKLEMRKCEQQLKNVSGGVPVSVTVAKSERGLLKALQEIIFEKFDRDYNRIIAYNADSWSGGFDLPFLRTRCIKNDLNWVFNNLQFADVFEPVKKRLNTQHTAYGNGSDVNTLVGSHEILFNEVDQVPIETTSESVDHIWYQGEPYDPFADSGSAVEHYKREEFLPILQHNLADVHRTWELGEVIREYVSSKDLTYKKL